MAINEKLDLILAINEKLDLILAKKRKSIPPRPQAPRQEVSVSNVGHLFLISPVQGARMSRKDVYLHIRDYYPNITRKDAYKALRQWHLEAVGKPIRETVQYYKGRRGEYLFHGICITR